MSLIKHLSLHLQLVNCGLCQLCSQRAIVVTTVSFHAPQPLPAIPHGILAPRGSTEVSNVADGDPSTYSCPELFSRLARDEHA